MNLIYFKTVSLCAAFFVYGLSMSCLGPTLPTLADNLQTHVDNLSHIVTARGGGYMIGSLIGGFLYEKMNKSLLLMIALLMTSTTNFLIPFLNAILLPFVFFWQGISMSIIETGGNVYMLELWKEKSPPYMQMVHFMFGFGACISPLIAEPFIKSSQTSVSSALQSSHNQSTEALFDTINATTTSQVIYEEVSSFPDVAPAYFVVAASNLFVSLAFACILVASFYQNKADAIIKENKGNDREEKTNKCNKKKTFRLLILTFLFLLFVMYVGIMVGFSSYLYTFVTTSPTHPMDKYQGTLLNTVFWAALAAGRLLSVPTAMYLSLAKMMALSLFLATTSSFSLLFYPMFAEKHQCLIWIIVTFYGLGIASIFPTGISWGAQYIEVNGRAASILVVGGSVGEMLIPLLIGFYIGENPMSLIYINVACAVAMVLIFTLLVCIAMKMGKKIDKNRSKDEKEVELLNMKQEDS